MPRLSKIGAACLAAFGFGSGGVAQVTATYLIVAGGGGSGRGGGGAGGLQTSTVSLNPTLSYTVIVGAGGAAGGSYAGLNGSNSSFSAVATASVGGGGGGYNSVGGNGGSGGGGAYLVGGSPAAGGSGTAGQGYAGGTSGAYSGNYYTGGGGGAGAAGTAGGPGNGGIGVSSSITGTATYYAGGGGGTGDSGTAGTGGNGGGGAGVIGGTGNPGGANLGGGAGGGGNGNNGGSGVVIIRYAGVQQFGGGIVTYDGTNTIHTFKTSGQLVPLNSLTASYLIVAGGAGGGTDRGGGGGAGGLLTGSTLTIDTSSTYLITVGAGGAGGSGSTGSSVAAGNGGNSSISIVSTAAVGGGGGGTPALNPGTGFGTGIAGGSGGGGTGTSTSGVVGGAATSGQGYAGGTGYSDGSGYYSTAGGGGAGAVGSNGTSSGAGAGGVGVSSSITGTATYYAGGGGGSADNRVFTAAGAGGNGGGGAGGALNSNGNAGTANTGGGGGGGSGGVPVYVGGNGGSGIVVIRYAGSTQLMAGGTVTITGGYVIHTFTSSGYLTPLTFIGNSLRFRSSASAYLSRTPSVAGSTTTWTWSAWIKRGSVSSTEEDMFGIDNSNRIAFSNSDSSQKIIVENYNGAGADYYVMSSAVYRDPSAWYHIVVTWDSTNAVAADRQRVYVNGTRVTSYTSGNSIPQNATSKINTAIAHNIGRSPSGSYYCDMYMADVRFIDGQALTPNSFGSFNSFGVWQPINYGGSYGTNGFYLPFTANSTSSYAGSFDGSSKALIAGSVANWKFLNDGSTWTAEAWVYPTSVAATQTIFCTNASTAGTGIFIGIGDTTSGDITVGIYKSVAGTGFGFSTAGGIVKANKWQHIAVTLSSTTFTVYLNGVAVGSTPIGSFTFNNANPSQNLQIGRYVGSTGSFGGYFTGYISNARLINTVIYTGNFTPSTTLPTAVSGTQLLTLQNSSIVDNSTNGYSITNVGSVATSVQYPLNTSVFDDQSPQGNHWTPTNISGLYGSSYDYMTDVPTLTSATAANYCTINPLAAPGGWTASNGNLTVSTTSVTNQFGTLGSTTGKFYFEYTPTTSADSWIGVMNLATNAGISLYRNDGTRYSGGSYVAYGATYTNGDTIGCAFDIDNGTIQFFKNGTSQGTVSSIPYNGGIIGPILLSGVSGGYNVNFGQQPFKYTPPTGFVALNTYNL